MDDISREVGISKKTLYQHFENKKGLIETSMRIILEEDKNKIKQIVENKQFDALGQMVEIFKFSIKLLQSIRPTVIYDLKKYYKDSWVLVESNHMNFMKSIIIDNIKLGKKQEIYRENIDGDLISALFISKMIVVTELNPSSTSVQTIMHNFSQNLLYHLYGIIDKSQYDRLKNLSFNLI